MRCEERAVNDDKLMERLRLTQATAQLPRRLARGLVGGNTRWAPQPSAELSAEGLERTVCAVGAALHLQRTVPSLFAHGLAVDVFISTYACSNGRPLVDETLRKWYEEAFGLAGEGSPR